MFIPAARNQPSRQQSLHDCVASFLLFVIINIIITPAVAVINQ